MKVQADKGARANAAPLAGKKHAPERLGRVLVLGLGKSGAAAVSYLAPLAGGRVEALCVYAGARTPAAERLAAEFADCPGVEVVFDRQQVEGTWDLCVASPGIAPHTLLFQSAQKASAELIGEVELAWRESASDSCWVAVTGTNGKTTTCALIAHVLTEAGFSAAAVGNIGDPCIEAVRVGKTAVYVAEVSSYQLYSTRLFAPDAAVLLNITPDHLHWHGTLEAYRDAKLRMLANLPGVPGAVAVLDATNDVVRAEVRRLRALSPIERGFAYVPLGTKAGLAGDMRAACGSDNAAFVGADGMLRVALGGAEHELVSTDELQIKGAHNAGNALAAAAAALALGAEPSAVTRALRSFAPLEHRIEPCGTVRGAVCYNDSKATNVDAACQALAAFPAAHPIVLLGGDDKGTDLAPLVAAACEHARAVVCFGAAGPRFAEAFKDGALGGAGSAAGTDGGAGFRVLSAAHLEDAFDVALALAEAGDVVLLSPACASFDEFGSFEERGRAFKSLVAARAASLGA